jgi:hypothetical protein
MSANTCTAAQGTNEAEEFCIVDWSTVLVGSVRSSSAWPFDLKNDLINFFCDKNTRNLTVIILEEEK